MIAYLVVRLLTGLLSLLPVRAALAIGRALAWVAFHVVRVRRGVVLANIEHVMGDRTTPAERKEIAHEAYRQTAMMFIETLCSSGASARLAAQVTVPDLARFPPLRDAKTPLIFLQPHAGNFDLAAYAFASHGFPHHTVMRPIKNPRIHDLIVRTRERHGITVHVKGPDSYAALRGALERGEWIGLLPDQNAKSRGVTVDWLGKPASIFRGPALLHLETKAQIVVVVDRRLPEDPTRHEAHMTFLPPHAPTGDEQADVRAIMQAVADAVAARVKLAPGQYFWFHRLWGKAAAGQ